MFTGIESTDNDFGFKISPNPVVNVLMLDVNDFPEKIRMSIYSYDGQLKMKKILRSNHSTIEVSNFKSGVYFLILSTNEVSYSKKFVVQ